MTDFRWRDATTVLLTAIITDAYDRGFAEVDFLRGDEAYKNNFAPQRRDLLRLRGAAGGTGRVALAADTAARKARLAAARSARSARSRSVRTARSVSARVRAHGRRQKTTGPPCWRRSKGQRRSNA
jgi:CelD/BcsL family acetyltransferase involved in cellulose biosynthesis